MPLPLAIVVGSAIAVGLVQLFRSGTRQMHELDAAKLDVLRGYENRGVTIGTETGGNARVRKLLSGVLRDVSAKGVTIELANGRKRFVPLGGVNALDDETGARIADWWPDTATTS